MDNVLKPHAMFGILFGMLLSIEIWCFAAIIAKALD